MKRLMTALGVALMLVALPLAAQERDEDRPKKDTKPPVKPRDDTEPPVKPRDDAKSPGNPPRAVYQHKTMTGRLGKFELNGKQGKADYYFNSEHHQDDLVYTRSAEMRDPSLAGPTPGWVYQVSRKGKKESLWFFFAADPLAKGGDQYAMFYSTTTPNEEGKQPWMRIRTPGGTKKAAVGREDE